jgi:alpha-beta hydrolase superfamily lysophospholipase
MKLLSITFLFLLSFSAYAGVSERVFKMNTSQECYIRTVIQSPDNGMKTKADLLFFIGFGDRADNHGPLFKLMTEQGIRVISFDYPTHGKSRCSHLDYETFTSLSDMAQEIEEKTREDVNRPLFVSGWSTGGLLAIRMIQNNFLAERFVQGLILIAPGVSVYTFVGGDGIIRERTLLQNPTPPHNGPPSPVSPFLTPVFAVNLKLNSQLARESHLPNFIPTLVLVAGEKLDKYVKTPVLKEWIKKERMTKSNLTAFQCENSMHEMDNEIGTIGPTVRNLIKDFINNQQEKLAPYDTAACKSL